jgi:hypothetical protein
MQFFRSALFFFFVVFCLDTLVPAWVLMVLLTGNKVQCVSSTGVYTIYAPLA